MGESLLLPLRLPLPQAEAGRKGAIYAKPCAVRGPLEQGLIRIGIAHGRKEFSDFAQRRRLARTTVVQANLFVLFPHLSQHTGEARTSCLYFFSCCGEENQV